MIDQGSSPVDICNHLLCGLAPQVLEEDHAAYRCDCSRERVSKMLSSIQPEELRAMRDEDKGCEVCCHFCGKKYQFSEGELTEMLEKKSPPTGKNY